MSLDTEFLLSGGQIFHMQTFPVALAQPSDLLLELGAVGASFEEIVQPDQVPWRGGLLPDHSKIIVKTATLET